MQTKPTLLWDFDGTLAHRPGHQRGAMMWALDFHLPGHKITIDQLKPFMRNILPWHMPETAHHHLNTPQAWWQHVENIFFNAFVGLGLPNDIASKLAKTTHEHYIDADGFIQYPKTADVLASVQDKGWQNIILSNHVPELSDIVAGKGLSEYFSHCISSACIGFEKPNIEAFKYAKELAGNPEEIVMIGDNINADYYGAKNAGIKAILIHNEPDESVEFFAESIVDVETVLDRIAFYTT